MRLTFDSVSDLARALRLAANAHGQYEEQTGRPDPDWPSWYAEFMMRTLGEDGTGPAGPTRTSVERDTGTPGYVP